MRKIKRYLLKRDNRQWEKKVSYDCRKKVADKRMRIKGRFIKKEDQQQLIKQKLWSQNNCKERVVEGKQANPKPDL